MALPPSLQNLRIPAFGAPLFIIQNPDLVLAQCKAGIPGCFPALNAREKDGEPVELDRWLQRITEELDRYNQANPDCPAAPYAINQIVHRSNVRLERDLEIMVKWRVPIVVTSLGARVELNEAVHSYGGITLHDIINNRFAKKAIEKGADGLIAVAAGAGGHAGAISPFALVQEIREWFDGPLLLSGSRSFENTPVSTITTSKPTRTAPTATRAIAIPRRRDPRRGAAATTLAAIPAASTFPYGPAMSENSYAMLRSKALRSSTSQLRPQP